jgi:hypothetical protein
LLLSNDPSASLLGLNLLLDSTLFINGEFSQDDEAEVLLAVADPFLLLPEVPWRRSLIQKSQVNNKFVKNIVVLTDLTTADWRRVYHGSSVAICSFS